MLSQSFKLLMLYKRPHSTQMILLITIFLSEHFTNKANKVVGQLIIPMIRQPLEPTTAESGLVPRSYLQPCEVVTLQTQCTEEEYESNEDCLPQKKDNCDRSKELYCHSGVCLSNCHPHKETYDEIQGKCFRIVNSDCRSNNVSTTNPTPTQTSSFSFNDNENNQQEQNGNLQVSTVIVPECVTNAICVKGQCKCAKNFTYNHLFGKCMLTANYAGFCNDTITCDTKSDIICKENHCQCTSPETQYFHLKRKRCYIKLGEICSTGLQFCPDNSNCVKKRTDNYITAAEDSIDENNAILYSSPFTPEYKHFQKNSTPKEDRYHQLRWLYKEHLNSVNDVGEEEHFIGIWGENEEEKEFACKCDKGYGSTQDKFFCLGLYGSRCNIQHRCNLERGLKCIDGVCLCGREKGNEQTFSEQFQTCITRIGAPCLENGKGEREPDTCPIGGSCKEEKCVCDKALTPGSSTASQGKNWIAYSCMKSHGMLCKNNSTSISSLFPLGTTEPFEPPCNHEIGLECDTNEGKCLCRDSNQFYDVRQRNCRSFQGIDTKIPVIHFTPPNDREYNFKRKSAGEKASSNSKIFTISLLFVFYNIFC